MLSDNPSKFQLVYERLRLCLARCCVSRLAFGSPWPHVAKWRVLAPEPETPLRIQRIVAACPEVFTPSLTFGALLGVVLGHAWSWFWPGVPPGLFALLGAGAVLAATTQDPISSVVLIMELTGRDHSFVLPLLLIAAVSTLIARSIEDRSIYDAKLTDEEVAERRILPEQPTV
jgi:hypothetical protein